MFFIYLSFYRSNKISRYQDIDRSIARYISLSLSITITISVYLSISIALFPNIEIYSLKQTPTDCLCNACKYLATTAYTDTDAPVDVFRIQVQNTAKRRIRANDPLQGALSSDTQNAYISARCVYLICCSMC